MEVPVLKIAQNSSTNSEEYVMHAMKTVGNVLVTQKTNVRLVGMISIFISILVMMLAQHHTTLMITIGHVKYVMKAVRNVQIRNLILDLSVNKASISNLNLITKRVLQLAQRDTTLMITTGHAKHVTSAVRGVIQLQMIAQHVEKGGISSFPLIRVLQSVQ